MAGRVCDGGRDEQLDLRGLEVRPVRAGERDGWRQLMSEHHYLRSAALLRDALRYVAEIDGRWLALLGWATAAFKCKPRDRWIGWSPTSQWRRLRLVVCNARFLVLPGARVANLASKTLALSCRRLSEDWRAAFGHPVLVAETFVDPRRFRGTCYVAAGWEVVGTTKGFGRRGGRYIYHGEGKLVLVKPLRRDARRLLADPLPHPELLQEDRSMDVLSLRLVGPGSLYESLGQVTDYRKPRGVRYRRMQGLLTIAAAAVLAGQRSYVAIGEWAQALPEDLVKALGGTYSKRARRFRAPSGDTLRRAILNVDAEQVDRIVGNWIIKQGISMSDGAIAIDGKTLRGSYRKASKPVHLLAALTHREGVVIAQQRVSDKSNEIPAAREILDHLDLAGAMVTRYAMHTQTATADYLTKKKGRITSSR